MPSLRPPAASNLSGKEGYVLNMWTDPAHRRRGIGAAVLREIVAHARAARIGRLRLHATDAGRRLYEQFGFNGSSTEMVMSL
jgi:ribosomal protein S18 acetylase RimI-like enzyme